MLTNQLKLCRKCGVEKPLTDFYNDKNRCDGKYPNCIECHGAYVRDRYHTNPIVKQNKKQYESKRRLKPEYAIEAKKRSQRFYSSAHGRVLTFLKSAQRRDPNATVTYSHLMNLLRVGYCPVTGIQFDLSNDHQRITGRAKNPYSPSIDRIDSLKGYSNENVRLVIWQYNMMKGELSDREILEICQRIVGRAFHA